MSKDEPKEPPDELSKEDADKLADRVIFKPPPDDKK